MTPLAPCALALALIALAAPVAAQSQIIGQFDTRITGTVEDETGKPLAGYPVIITEPRTRQNIVVFTDKDGAYSVEGLAAGEYQAVPGTDTARVTPFSVTLPDRRWFQQGAQGAETVTLPEIAVPLGPVSR